MKRLIILTILTVTAVMSMPSLAEARRYQGRHCLTGGLHGSYRQRQGSYRQRQGSYRQRQGSYRYGYQRGSCSEIADIISASAAVIEALNKPGIVDAVTGRIYTGQACNPCNQRQSYSEIEIMRRQNQMLQLEIKQLQREINALRREMAIRNQ